MQKQSLLKILQHYGVEHTNLTREPSQHDLAVMVARMFEATEVLEDEVVSRFAEKYCYSGSDQGVPTNVTQAKKRVVSNRDVLDKDPAVPGEQVAAKANRGEDDGQWILANVIDFDPRNLCYVVQDEDDPNRVLTLSVHEVKRLEDRSSHLRRHDLVLAVFPETTSFYRAVVAKNPKPPAHFNATWDLVVRFENDEDETGKNPARRVPARFVLRRSDVEECEESDEEES
jgi:hypothetical protein